MSVHERLRAKTPIRPQETTQQKCSQVSSIKYLTPEDSSLLASIAQVILKSSLSLTYQKPISDRFYENHNNQVGAAVEKLARSSGPAVGRKGARGYENTLAGWQLNR